MVGCLIRYVICVVLSVGAILVIGVITALIERVIVTIPYVLIID